MLVVIGIVILLTFCLPYFTVDGPPGESTASPQTHSTGLNSQLLTLICCSDTFYLVVLKRFLVPLICSPEISLSSVYKTTQNPL